MNQILEYNPDASSYDFKKYIEEKGLVETKEGYFRVATGMKREDAIDKLLDLAGDMMCALDVMPSGVDPRGKILHFGNQFGVFYIDGIEDPLPKDYQLTKPPAD